MFCHRFDSLYPLLLCEYFLRRVDPGLISVPCSVGVDIRVFGSPSFYEDAVFAALSLALIGTLGG